MVTLGVGWFGVQVFWAFHSGSMPLFLKRLIDSKFKISLVISLAGLAGCIVPPLVGYISDRTQTRFGRRKPYIFLGFLGVFLCVVGMPSMASFGVVAILAGAMYFALRFAETPYLSLLPDITPPEQRSTASGVMNLLGSIGLITCFVASSVVWEMSYAAVFYMVAFACFGSIILAVTLVQEPDTPPKNVEASAVPIGYIKGILQESNAMKFFVAQFFWWLGFWMVSSFATLFVVEELQVAEGKSFLVLMTFSIVATIFMLPLGMLGDRYGRKGILTFMVGLWAVLEILVGLSQTLTHAMITVGISAIPFAAVMGVGYAFFLDLIPRDRTAEFVGFSIISIATSQIIGPMTGGILIDTLGYRSIFPAAAFFMLTGLVILQCVQPPKRRG